MKIGIYHGYELIGSGSNEYTRYMARELVKQGHHVDVMCRETHPEALDFVSTAFRWFADGSCELIYENNSDYPCVLHQLPEADVKPVYVTDKKRSGNVKSFTNLTDEELAQYHQVNHTVLSAILQKYRFDLLHCNHLVYQPVAAMQACLETQTPYIIFLHGSAIEYTVRGDARYEKLALEAIIKCDGIISGNRQVRDRLPDLFPDYKAMILAKSRIVGIGVDTQLFQSVKKQQRNTMLEHLQAYDGPLGKPPQLFTDLKRSLDQQGAEATSLFWDAYNDYAPDEDFLHKVQQIPWQDGNIILFVGALTSGKGLQSVIPALPAIIERHPDTHMVIIGGGAYREVLEALVYAISSGNKKLLLELCQKGIDLDRNDKTGPWTDVLAYINEGDHLAQLLEKGQGLEEHVHFLGRLNHDYLQYVFPCADIGMFPSIGSEAYGLVLMEALSNGVFPMVTYFSGFVDGIDELQHYLDGSVVERMKISIDDIKRIPSIIDNVNAVIDLLAKKPLADQLRPIAVENYDWRIRTEQLIKAYQSLL